MECDANVGRPVAWIEWKQLCWFASYVIFMLGPTCEWTEGAENVKESVSHFVVECRFVSGGGAAVEKMISIDVRCCATWALERVRDRIDD